MDLEKAFNEGFERRLRWLRLRPKILAWIISVAVIALFAWNYFSESNEYDRACADPQSVQCIVAKEEWEARHDPGDKTPDY